jgi:hypothetical protein
VKQSGDTKGDRLAQQQASSDLQSGLEKLQGVSKAEVHYNNDMNSPASLLIVLTVTPGSTQDGNALVASAEGTAWKSRLHPIHEISITTSGASGPQRGQLEVALNTATRAALTQKFGPRPVSDAS